MISLLVVEISSFDHGNIGNSGLTPLTRRPRRMTPQYPTPESPKNAGILGKFMLVKTPDDQLNSDFLLVEKSGGKKSLVKLDEKIGNDERIERPMGMINKCQLSFNKNSIFRCRYSICENISRLSPIYREGSFEAKSSRNMHKTRTRLQ